MSVHIKSVRSRGDLRRFICFNERLYRGNPYSVPGLFSDELDCLLPSRNPAYEFCEAELFLAYKDGRIAGRVAAIVNHRTNEDWHEKAVRFGWIDFIDDIEVSQALIDRVTEWGRERGMTAIHGPLGFVDFDREGMLVEGFDRMATMSTIYNYPYYPEHMKRLGFEKELGWIEMHIKVPEAAPERHTRMCEAVMKRYGLKVFKSHSIREIKKRYADDVFRVLNEGYKDIHGYSALTDRQIIWYINKYFNILDHRMVCVITDTEDRLVGIGISMPSLSVALQKGRGRMFPFGWWHLLKALLWKRSDTLDLLLVAVASDYRNKGVTAIMLTDLVRHYIDMGFKWGETTLELEDNSNVQSMWSMYEHEIHKRHTLFRKNIE